MQMQKADKRPYLLFVGRSGSGKSTVADILAEQGLRVLSSYTTRKPRSPEEKGHIFIDNEDFNNLSDICAYTEFDGYRYCATNEQIENSDIYIIDIAGVNYFKAAYTGEKDIVVMYFGITPSIAFGRMLDRGDTVMKAAERLEHDNIAFSNENVEQLMSLFPVRKVCTGLGAGYASIKIMEFWESRMECYKKDC
jgi:guanylate kinase